MVKFVEGANMAYLHDKTDAGENQNQVETVTFYVLKVSCINY